MILNWEDLTVQDLIDLSQAAERDCSFEMTSCTAYSGRIEGYE